MKVLDHVLAAIFGQRRNRHADDFAVIRGIEAQIGGPNGLVNQRDCAGVPRRNDDCRRLGHRQRAELIHRHLRAVVIHSDMVEQGDVRAPGAHTGKLLAKIFDSLFHSRARLRQRVFTAVCRQSCAHSSQPFFLPAAKRLATSAVRAYNCRCDAGSYPRSPSNPLFRPSRHA